MMGSEIYMSRVTQALSKPIQSRCADLVILFEKGSTRDLQALFPLLIDNIFGPQGTLSWGLRTITATLKPQDFHVLQNFLSPCGPVFHLIYNLLKDPFIKYDFSVTYLPTKVRLMLESANINPFYTDLMHVSPQNKQVVSLMLNPFDYYMFHFAYYLINPWHQRTGTTLGSSWSTVYYILCCDYVLHFLPTTIASPILPVINYNGKNPIQQYHPQISRPVKVSKLIKTNLFGETPKDYNVPIQPLEKHPRSEIWRSETVLMVFLDMWLNNDQINRSYESNFNIPSLQQQSLHFNELPAGEYIRIIRILVKQLHAFAATGKVDDSNLGELKKITLVMMQGKMYIFLRNLIHRWPLDGSFRLVLELWLSFIQPWRYPGHPHTKILNQPEIQPDNDDNTNNLKAIDREYLPFIADNILSYIVIFQQLLPRFLRVDLVSPKNSLMLYRLTKVFDQPNLVDLIREVESYIDLDEFSPKHTFNVSRSMPPLSPTFKWSSNTAHYDLNGMPVSDSSLVVNGTPSRRNVCINPKYAGIVRQKIYDLEGPNFCFKPLFTAAAAPEVYELIVYIKKAEIMAQNIIQGRLSEIERNSSGFLGIVKSLFWNPESSNDEFTLEERKKVPLYLSFSLQYLMDMFQIQEPVPVESHVTPESSFSASQQQQQQPTPEYMDNSIESLLTPRRVMERIKSITYEGDPDLHPVRSNECKLLVRMFYHWATKINERYQPLINKLYYREDMVGKFSRQIIMPPQTIHRYDKSEPGRSPRITEYLPPRISLRRYASHQFLTYACIAFLISKYFDYSIITFTFIVFILWFIVTGVKALIGKSQVSQHDLQGNDMSFNESF